MEDMEQLRAGIFNSKRIQDKQINLFIGIAKGLIADRVLVDKEVEYLEKWLKANNANLIKRTPILTSVLEQVTQITKDGVISDEEREDLFQALEYLSGGAGAENNKPIGGIYLNEEEAIVFSEKCFCFTGVFEYGYREKCSRATEALGGEIKSDVGAYLDYLVVGSISSTAWAMGNYGRKIEKAIDLQQDACPIKIVHEDHWMKEIKKHIKPLFH